MTKFVNRSKIRFLPDNNELGLISFDLEEFSQDIAALIINESLHGVCLVVNRKLIPTTVTINIGLMLLVKAGKLDPMEAVVRWVKEIDEELVRIGIEYKIEKN